MATKRQTDGRTARALRTREAIVDATIGLVEDGDLRPTAPRIADRAQVSVRSVFQHFDDLESLHAAVAERITDRVTWLLAPVDPALPLEARAEYFVHQRSQLLEVISPIRRAAFIHAPFSEEITGRLEEGHRFLRDEVARTFAPELDRHGDDERRDLLDALDATLSWSVWETVRHLSDRSPEDARRVVVRMVVALLSS